MIPPSAASKWKKRLALLLLPLLGGIAGCSCHKTDEEILRERLDTTSVHLYLASKIAILKADQSPEAKRARDDLVAVMKSIEGTGTATTSSTTPAAAPVRKMTAHDTLVLLQSLYSLKSEGRDLLRSGNEKGMKPFLPLLFQAPPGLQSAFDLSLEHAILLVGLFVAKFHPKTQVPVPDEIALYEAWMTDPSALKIAGLAPFLRTIRGVLFANNDLCDLARREVSETDAEAARADAATLSDALGTLSGEKTQVTAEQARAATVAFRALGHGTAAICYMKRDRGDDGKKAVDELDAFVKAADEMGIRSTETALIGAYVAIRRGDRARAKSVLEEASKDPGLARDPKQKKDIDDLLAHLNDDGFVAKRFHRLFFLKTVTVMVLRHLDEAGVFDALKRSALARAVDGYVGATGRALEKGKDALSTGTDAVRDKLKDVTGK